MSDENVCHISENYASTPNRFETNLSTPGPVSVVPDEDNPNIVKAPEWTYHGDYGSVLDGGMWIKLDPFNGASVIEVTGEIGGAQGKALIQEGYFDLIHSRSSIRECVDYLAPLLRDLGYKDTHVTPFTLAQDGMTKEDRKVIYARELAAQWGLYNESFTLAYGDPDEVDPSASHPTRWAENAWRDPDEWVDGEMGLLDWLWKRYSVEHPAHTENHSAPNPPSPHMQRYHRLVFMWLLHHRGYMEFDSVEKKRIAKLMMRDFQIDPLKNDMFSSVGWDKYLAWKEEDHKRPWGEGHSFKDRPGGNR